MDKMKLAVDICCMINDQPNIVSKLGFCARGTLRFLIEEAFY